MRTAVSPEYRVRCQKCLAALSQSDLIHLTEFAERRLMAQGLDPSAGEDACQRALMSILQGLEPDQGGRVPRSVDTESKERFLNFVRGAISSTIEAMGRKRQFRAEREPWQEDRAVAEATPLQLTELSDLKNSLFPRLRARAPERLKRTIEAWEAVFTYSDRIPAPGHRKYVREVQMLAQEIISDLGGIR